MSIPCRLYFILAREAPVGVLFRRGPSRWVQLTRWNTETDRLEHGQWFHGRIYEKRCDLSPDGSLLIYFASKQHASARRRTGGYGTSWTAISRPPYLTALALWPKGDCWHGGGLFQSDSRVWLNHLPFQAVPHPDHLPEGLVVEPEPHAHGEDDPVHFRRLERDGWIIRQRWRGYYDEGSMGAFFRRLMERGLSVEEMKRELLACGSAQLRAGQGFITEAPAIFEKSASAGKPVLRMEHALVGHTPTWTFAIRRASGENSELQGTLWADWDHRGRLVHVRDGRLFAAELRGDGELDEREVYDFNPATPEALLAPDWARSW